MQAAPTYAEFLILTASSTPNTALYRGGGDGNLVALPDLSGVTGNVLRASFSPGGVYLALACQSSPYIRWFKRNGNSFTALPAPATLPAGLGRCCKWSPDGQYLAVAHNTSPFITCYKRSGDTLTKLANPASMLTGVNRSPAWSPDGTYLAVGSTTSPYLAVYKKEGTAFSRLADPAVLPPGTVYGVAWSPGGNQLITTSFTAGNAVSVYEFESGALGSSTTLPFAYGNCAAFGATSS